MGPPPPRLVTRRLVIRTATARDVPALVEYAVGEAREMARFAPRRPASHFTAAHWRKHVRVLEESRRLGRSVVFHLFTKERPARLVGHVGLGNIVRGVFQAAHLGYALRKEFEGRGLMTEALRAIIPYAFGTMRLHRLMANHLPSNRRSAKVLRRFRFRREGIAKDYLLIAGRWRDHVNTSLVNRRWKPLPDDEAARAAAGRGRQRPSR
jgi:ribosomal-protein-alanine N-acetyltransferase